MIVEDHVPRRDVAAPRFAPGLARADRVVVIVSDIEMGLGGPTDDFLHHDFLAGIVDDYTSAPWAERPVDLVFNGDTFDFLKLPVEGAYPTHVTRALALAKLASIVRAHGPFFSALGRFLAHGSGWNRVFFVVGNHDAELLFPAVQRALCEACGGSDRVLFPGFELTLGPIHIEHGSQLDPLFYVDPGRPFINADPEPLLNLSWASIGLLSVVIPLHPLLYVYDRLVPKKLLMELVPEMRELFTALAWRYWTRDFWHGFLVQKDPLLHVDWTMLKEVIRLLVFSSPNVDIDRSWLTNTVEARPAELFVTGHLHHLAHTWHGAKRIVQAGAFRDEYLIEDGGAAFSLLPKCWIEVIVRDGHVQGVATREVAGPARPRDHLPETIFDLVPIVRAQLAAMEDRTHEEVDRQRHEDSAEPRRP